MYQAIETGRTVKPFKGGHGACQFLVTFYKQRFRTKLKNKDDDAIHPQLWKLATNKTLLRHCPHCPGVLKLKARQLIAHPGFRNQVSLYPTFFVFLHTQLTFTCCTNVVPVIRRSCVRGKLVSWTSQLVYRKTTAYL